MVVNRVDEIADLDEDALRRCDKIIWMFIATPNPSINLVDNFHAWLINGRNCREKDHVLRRLFDEQVTKLMPENELEELIN